VNAAASTLARKTQSGMMRVDIVFVTQTISFKHVFHPYLKKNVHWLRLGVDVDPVEPTAARMGLMDVPVRGKGRRISLSWYESQS